MRNIFFGKIYYFLKNKIVVTVNLIYDRFISDDDANYNFGIIRIIC